MYHLTWDLEKKWPQKSNTTKAHYSRISKISRGGLNEWINKCGQYFEFDKILKDAKVRIPSVYLDGKALWWHQNFIENRINKRVPG